MKNEKNEMEFSDEMQAGFYVEELENRLEMAPIGGGTGPVTVPNAACWEINF